MLNDLKNKVVDMVYVDIFSLLDYQFTLEEKSLKLAFIDSKITAGYGFALSGLSTALKGDVKSFIEEKSAAISSFAQSLQGRLPVCLFIIFILIKIFIQSYTLFLIVITLPVCRVQRFLQSSYLFKRQIEEAIFFLFIYFKKLVVENADETIKGLFSEKSSTYQKSLIYLGILIAGMIILGLCIGFKRRRANAKVQDKRRFPDNYG